MRMDQERKLSGHGLTDEELKCNKDEDLHHKSILFTQHFRQAMSKKRKLTADTASRFWQRCKLYLQRELVLGALSAEQLW